MVQVLDGTYRGYIVDNVSAENADTNDEGIDFGTDCSLTFDTNNSPALDIDNVNVFADTSGCTDPDGSATAVMDAVANESTVHAITSVVVNAPPGPAYIGNVLGADSASWPMIYGFDFADDNLIEYGNEAISFTFGPKAAGVSFTSTDTDGIVVPGQKVQLTIDDNGLNIDPTTVDSWKFLATVGSEASDRI